MILRELLPTDEILFKSAVREFEQSDPCWQFAFHFNWNAPFSEYLDTVNAWSEGRQLNGFVPNTFLVAEVAGAIIGRVSIRHQLNDFLMYEEGGHIGYGVVPSYRRKGHATEMLKLSLPIARSLGLSRVLLTTDQDNPGSIAVIKKNGGTLEKTRDPRVKTDKLRFWITL